MNTEKRYVATSIGIVVLTIVAIVLSGCAEFTAGRAAVIDTGAAINDEALISAEMVICRAASVGSVERRFMRSEADWELWNRMCRGDRPLPLPE